MPDTAEAPKTQLSSFTPAWIPSSRWPPTPEGFPHQSPPPLLATQPPLCLTLRGPKFHLMFLSAHLSAHPCVCFYFSFFPLVTKSYHIAQASLELTAILLLQPHPHPSAGIIGPTIYSWLGFALPCKTFARECALPHWPLRTHRAGKAFSIG